MNLNRLGYKITIIRQAFKMVIFKNLSWHGKCMKKNDHREYLLSAYHVPDVLRNGLYGLIPTPLGDRFYHYPSSKNCGLEEELA